MLDPANTNRLPKPDDLRFTRDDIALVVHAEFCQVLREYGIQPDRFRQDRKLNRRAEATADFLQMAALDHFRPTLMNNPGDDPNDDFQHAAPGAGVIGVLATSVAAILVALWLIP